MVIPSDLILVDQAKALFGDCTLEQPRKECQYLEQHRQRIVNYAYFQTEGISIGSGAVESSPLAD